eukprot:scaffold137285_cov17-Prasinocladus_malaysianus.AAC.1
MPAQGEVEVPLKLPLQMAAPDTPLLNLLAYLDKDDADFYLFRAIILLEENRGYALEQNKKTLETPLHLAAKHKAGHALVPKLLGVAESLARESDRHGNKPLHLACASGAPIDVIQAILRAHPDAAEHQTNADRQTPLHLAVRQGHVGAVKVLVDESPAAAELEDVWRYTPLMLAAQWGQEGTVETLMDSYRSTAGLTAKLCSIPLQFAATEGHKGVVCIVLHANPGAAEITSSFGYTALHCAAAKGHSGVVRALLKVSVCSAKLKTHEGYTPLHLAAKEGHEDAVQVLIEECPCTAGLKDRNGSTPLHLAVHERHEEIVRMLAKHSPGAADLTDKYGRTALHVAAQEGQEGILQMLVNASAAAADATDDDGCIPLHFAAKMGHKRAVQMLMEVSTGVSDLRNAKGRTPLHLAAQKCHEEVVWVLLSQLFPGATDIQDIDGCTPLHLAAQEGHKGVIQLLLNDSPVTAELKDNNGRTPLHNLMEPALAHHDCCQRQWLNIVSLFSLAVQFAGPKVTKEVAELLLSKAPESAHARDSFGAMPLHYACQFRAPVAVLQLLLSTYPEASKQRDNDGRLPLHIASEYCSNVGFLSLLCRSYQQGLAAPVSNTDGKLPLHFAVGRGPDAVEGIISVLLAHMPKSVKEVDGSRDLRKKLYLTRDGALPLHRAVEAGTPEPVVTTLLRNFTGGVLVRDNRGRGKLAVEAVPEGHCSLASTLWEAAKEECNASQGANANHSEESPSGRLVDFFHAMAAHPPCAGAVVDILAECPRMAEWRNERNFTTYDVASAQVRSHICQSRCFLGRYELGQSGVHPAHISDTCVVLLGNDVKAGSNQRVALKLMRAEEQFLQEVEMRRKHKLNQQYVVRVLRVHVGREDSSAELQHRLEARGLEVCWEGCTIAAHMGRISVLDLQGREHSGYKYCVILEQADRNLHDAITHEKIMGKWPQ